MNHLLDPDLDQDEAAPAGDREISLGPGTILGIFFALALLCGAVFGLGYSMGRRSGQSAAVPVMTGSSSGALSTSTYTAKPGAGSTVPPTRVPASADSTPAAAPAVSRAKVAPSDAIIAGDTLPRSTSSETLPAGGAVTGSALPVPGVSGNFMVQIAAVSTQEIADLELAALKKYNYPVVIRHEPTDQLLHIQLGPYATRKDAEAMRQNVLSHGFNAIIK